MVSLLFVVSALAALVFLLLKRSLRRRGAEDRFSFGLCAYSLELFVVLALVLAFYHLLLLFLVAGWQRVSVGHLLWLERSLNEWRGLLSRWTPGWIATLIILIVIYGLSLFQAKIFDAQGMLRGLKKTKTVFRIANIALVALCTFTLLGSDAGRPAATLEIRLQTIRKEYGVMRGQVEQAVLGLAANHLNDRTTQALGSPYTSAPQLLDRVDSSTAALRRRYGGFKQQYKQRNAQVEQTLQRYDVREAARRAAEARATDTTAAAGPQGAGNVEEPSLERAVPEETSYSQILQARAEVRRVAESVNPAVIKFLSRPAGREIVVHVVALIKGNKVAEVALGQLGDSYPILKAALKVLTSALSDAISKDLKKRIEKATSLIAANPSSAGNVLADVAKETADAVPVTVPPELRTDVGRATGELESEASRADGLQADLEKAAKAIESARIDQLFADLHSTSPKTREAAAVALSQMGKSMDQEHADRLMQMVRAEGDFVQTDSWRGEHCTHYERKAVKYYAGRAVEKMDSPHITDAMRREAEVAQTEEGGGIENERIDDPGWI